MKMRQYLILARAALFLAAIFIFSLPSAFPQPIIADHTYTDISGIPGEWIKYVQQHFKVYYGHASHGEQLVCGLQRISDDNSKYSFREEEYLPDDPDTLCFYSTYNDPDMFFSGIQGILNANPSINVAMFAWCGEASEYPIDSYTSQMEALEDANPGVKFIYMTGNAQEADCTGCGRYLFNQALRRFCRDHDKILFDFADLDVWAGDDYTSETYISPSWCECSQSYAIPLEHPDWHGDDCGHVDWESCDNKGRATWWMLARAAGWDGVSAGPTPAPSPTPALTPSPASSPAYVDISAATAGYWYACRWNVLFLDVRTESEYSGGHIEGAVNMPWVNGQVQGHENLPDKPAVVYCQTGNRSAEASRFLVNNGHAGIYNMLGGYNAWNSLPAYPPYILPAGAGDFAGNGSAAIALFRPGSGLWAIRDLTRFYFGGSGDIPVPGDYDGTGTTGAALFRNTTGLWAIRGVTRTYFGRSSDIALAGDYDGDGRGEPGIFRESSGLWAVQGVTRIYFGAAGDLPVYGDYNGDGSSDIALFRKTDGLWAIRGISRIYFGDQADIPVPGDYNGDGTWEEGISRPATGLWAIRGISRIYFGSSGDVEIPGDYDGAGTTRIGVFRISSGLWAVRGVTRVYYGTAGDIPVAR